MARRLFFLPKKFPKFCLFFSKFHKRKIPKFHLFFPNFHKKKKKKEARHNSQILHRYFFSEETNTILCQSQKYGPVYKTQFWCEFCPTGQPNPFSPNPNPNPGADKSQGFISLGWQGQGGLSCSPIPGCSKPTLGRERADLQQRTCNFSRQPRKAPSLFPLLIPTPERSSGIYSGELRGLYLPGQS